MYKKYHEGKLGKQFWTMEKEMRNQHAAYNSECKMQSFNQLEAF